MTKKVTEASDQNNVLFLDVCECVLDTHKSHANTNTNMISANDL